MAPWQAYNSRARPIELDANPDERPHTRPRPNGSQPASALSRSQLTVTIYDSDSSETLANDSDEEILVDAASPDNIGTDFGSLTGQTHSGFDPGDYLTDDNFESFLAAEAANFIEVIDLTEEPRCSFDRRSYVTCEGTRYHRRIIPQFSANGYVYAPGKSVELNDGTFLRILNVLEDRPGEIFLRGHRFQRLEDMGSRVPDWLNELCWIVDQATDDAVTTDVSLAEVKRFRTIHLTNWTYPNVSHRTSGSSFQSKNEARQKDELYCRLKQVTISSKHQSEVEVAIHYLTPTEADKEYTVSPALLRQLWRGDTPSFGSTERPKSRLQNEVIDLDNTPTRVIDLTAPSNVPLKQRRQYTFGDGFCGAGGVSCGAVQAGLHVKWAFDKDQHAANSYRLNFETAICETCDVTDFLTNKPEFLKVDVSHASPPCQTFSPAHTVESSNDDANSACIFSGRDLVERSKSRVHTMEETSGLYERHKPTFFGIVHDFIEIGYSVRWKVLHCIDYGVPQLRKRLFVIVAGPGDVLPAFPKPTHGPPGTDLLPYATIHSSISNIPDGTPDHDVAGALSRGLCKPPFDANIQARTITCSGGEFNYHPSGKRHYTNRELACLQTFPLKHRFGQQGVKKQIGNAVPPVLAKAVFREVIKSLQKTDEAELKAMELEQMGLGRAR